MNAKTQMTEALRDLVRGAMERRKQVLVYHTARKLHSMLAEYRLEEQTEGAVSKEWIRIESLSRLRALVGGRFQNLKDRWVSAGFPLREHRGDRSGKKSLDQEGWIELSSWIHKQGFEIRLAEAHEPWLFEVRKLASAD